MKLKIAFMLWALFMLQGFSAQLWAQALTVTGKVTSRVNNEPLAGATVTISGTNTATVTDEAGNFTITVPQRGARLNVSYAGMEAQEVTVNEAGTLNISLNNTGSTLNEVVVVGYGTQRRATVTSAISSVKAEELATVSSARIDHALQGRTAGVNIIPTSGAPGAGMRIRIRGTGSNLNADPLYIVDGVRTGGIDNLDPSEIASVDVLKDAASAAIYGSAAANGVILITTKTGRRNSSEINYSFQYGQQSIGDLPEMMNAQQYFQYLQEAKTNGAPTLADLAAVQGTGTNWFDALFQNAPLMRHSITFSGGSERSTFLVNGTYFTQEGIVGGSKSKFNRYTVRLNGDQRLKSWLNIGQRLSYANIGRKGIPENSEFGSIVGSAIAMDPFTPVVYTGALPQRAQDALAQGRTLVRDGNGNYYGVSNFIFGEYYNPLARIATINEDLNQHKIEGNAFIDIEPIRGLKFTSRFGIDGAFQRQSAWTPSFWFSNESLNTQAHARTDRNEWFSWQWENFANYQRKFGDHNIGILGGTSANRFNWNYGGGSFTNLFREDPLFAYATSGPSTTDDIVTNANSQSLLSFFGRLNYDYRGKYLLNATFRRDGASHFAKGHQWGNFPALSLGWVISNENFYGSTISDHVNYLKLRASWGRNGSVSNVGIGAWQALVRVINPGYPNPTGIGGFLVGATPTNLSNPELTWETSEQLDFGADLGLLNDRLSFTVDYYRKRTIDLLTPGGPSVPAFVGADISIINAGEVLNRGWEFDLAFRNRKANTSPFTYELSVNYTTLKNEVTNISEFTNELGGAGVGTGWNATVFKVGYPVWAFRGYQTDGIFQTEEEVAAYLSKTGITGYAPKPGEPIVVDVNGDKQITQADQTMIGSPHPKHIFGARANVGFKGFDLLVFAQGQTGNDVLMGFNRTDRPTANRPAFFFNNRWTGPGSTNSWFAANTNNQYIYNSDLMVFDGSYLRLRQLQLGYTLPKRVTDRAGLKATRLYISLDDFFTFTKYPGLNPEGGSGGANSLGIDRGVYPLSRKAMIGLSLNF